MRSPRRRAARRVFGLRLKTPEGKASRARDERNRGFEATLERGAGGATQPSGVFKRSLGLAALLAVTACMPAACAPRGNSTPTPSKATAEQIAFLDTLERRTFQWFWDLSDA